MVLLPELSCHRCLGPETSRVLVAYPLMFSSQFNSFQGAMTAPVYWGGDITSSFIEIPCTQLQSIFLALPDSKVKRQ